MRSALFFILVGAIFLLSALFILAIIFFIYRLALRYFKAGGWAILAKHYRAETQPGEALLKKQTIRVGNVRYRHCVTICLLVDGMYLAISLPGYASVRIPWREFHIMGKTRIYSRRADLWSIGKPEIARIALPLSLSEKMKPFVNEKNRTNVKEQKETI